MPPEVLRDCEYAWMDSSLSANDFDSEFVIVSCVSSGCRPNGRECKNNRDVLVHLPSLTVMLQVESWRVEFRHRPPDIWGEGHRIEFEEHASVPCLKIEPVLNPSNENERCCQYVPLPLTPWRRHRLIDVFKHSRDGVDVLPTELMGIIANYLYGGTRHHSNRASAWIQQWQQHPCFRALRLRTLW